MNDEEVASIFILVGRLRKPYMAHETLAQEIPIEGFLERYPAHLMGCFGTSPLQKKMVWIIGLFLSPPFEREPQKVTITSIMLHHINFFLLWNVCHFDVSNHPYFPVSSLLGWPTWSIRDDLLGLLGHIFQCTHPFLTLWPCPFLSPFLYLFLSLCLYTFHVSTSCTHIKTMNFSIEIYSFRFFLTIFSLLFL